MQNIKKWSLARDFRTVLYILTCCMCLFSQHWFLDSASESSESLTCGCKSTSGPIKVYWTSVNTIIDGMASVTYFRLYWINIWVHFANVVHMFRKGGLSGILLANDWWLTSWAYSFAPEQQNSNAHKNRVFKMGLHKPNVCLLLFNSF